MKRDIQFERAEFVGRLDNVKREMSKRGIDFLLLSEPSNHYYLTGYNAYSFYTPQMVMVGLDLPEPIWMGRFMDRISAVMTTYLMEDNIRAYADKYVHSALSPYDFMANIVKEFGGEKARIGVEMGAYYYSAKAHADLARALPHATFVDADVLVNWIRIVKSPAEIVMMREAGQIADSMMRKAVEMIEPGVRECDIAAVVYHAQITGTPEHGGGYACTPPFLLRG